MIGVKSQKNKQSVGVRNNASNSILIGQRILPNVGVQNNSNPKTNEIYHNGYSSNSQYIPLGLSKKSNIIKSSNLEKK